MAAIEFFSQDIPFKLETPRKRSTWIKAVIQKEKQSLIHLNFIFCSDQHLAKMNIDYLNHKTLTDIITFDNAEFEGQIEGDIFISIDRVKENAQTFHVSFNKELDRVIIHGVLHLLGYGDKSTSEKAIMRKKEDTYLSLRDY
jgi:probable rRNA maturation factor